MAGELIPIVEDNEKNRKLVRDVLRFKGYQTVETESAEEGLRVARESRPALILMDIQMPKLSGLEATRRLRADPRTAAIPLIVVTSFALSGDEQQAKEAGASAYIAKPYSPRELVALIRKLAPET